MSGESTTFLGYDIGSGDPSIVRFAHYDVDGQMIREIMHEGGRFAEPIEVKAGEYIALILTPPNGLATLRIVSPEPPVQTGYDSRPETWEHIHAVQSFLGQVITRLQARARVHDQSKLASPEVEVFDIVTPKLRELTYGSQEYKDTIAEMGEGLAHHYAFNDHHPEHFVGGIGEMNLVQIIEMLCDWKAATLRHADGDLERSIHQNAERFGYGKELLGLLLNTAASLGWIEQKPGPWQRLPLNYGWSEMANIAILKRLRRRIDGQDERPYNQDTDECPECNAKPGEPCIVTRAVATGFPDGVPDCPRDAG